MLHVALWEPEIPPNTGNVARLCAATGAVLHLVGRLGFRLDDRSLRRAGLDYWDDVDVRRHDTLAAFEAENAGRRVFCFTAHAATPYTKMHYQDGDYLLFGGETFGLPPEVPRALRRSVGVHPDAGRQGAQPQPGHGGRHCLI